MLNGMTLKMDKAGRVIVPKLVRDSLGLHESSDLEILKEDSHSQSLRLQL
jgi:AbrB family looped-hinge helix DNA binding protein